MSLDKYSPEDLVRFISSDIREVRGYLKGARVYDMLSIVNNIDKLADELLIRLEGPKESDDDAI